MGGHASKKTAVVTEWSVPQIVSELRSFLGLTNYVRRFIQAYANIVGPLNNDVPYRWTSACQQALMVSKWL